MIYGKRLFTISSQKVKVSVKTIEKQYLDEEISLQQYEELKFPDRQLKKIEESLQYPRPYLRGVCVICQNHTTGIVKCMHCKNLVCPDCIQSVFLHKESSQGSFLIMHRRFCSKFGRAPVMKTQVLQVT